METERGPSEQQLTPETKLLLPVTEPQLQPLAPETKLWWLVWGVGHWPGVPDVLRLVWAWVLK